MLNPSISGWITFSDASFSRVVSRRGCSSTAKVTCVPSRRVTSTGTISSTKRPASMAAIARWCERSAQASISSRLTPAWTAAFHPTVMDMSSHGASGVSGWLGGAQSSHSSVPRARRRSRGAVDADSTPPATTTRSMPARTVAAAVVTAASPPAQCRLWASPATSSSPARMATWRAMSPPPWRDSLSTTSSIRPASSPARRTASATTVVPRSRGSTSASVPRPAVPMAVRAVETIQASPMRHAPRSCRPTGESVERSRSTAPCGCGMVGDVIT